MTVATNPIQSWEAIDMELCKAEQMGQQTVLQFAKVGQLLIKQMGDQPIREFVQRAGQNIPRLTRSSCHNYMMLAKHLPLLEQKQPESQRAALALIAEARRPVTPAPVLAAPPPDAVSEAALDALEKASSSQAALLAQYIRLGGLLLELRDAAESGEAFSEQARCHLEGVEVEEVEHLLWLASEFDLLLWRRKSQ